MKRTLNPALRTSAFEASAYGESQAMTIQGTVIKTFVLLSLIMISGGWAWNKLAVISLTRHMGKIMYYFKIGGIAGVAISLLTYFKPSWSFITAPVYAICQGAMLGAISFICEKMYPGVVSQAISLTVATLAGMLLIYSSGLIKVTQKFRMMISSITAGICILYFASYLLRFFGIEFPLIHEASLLSIAFSGGVIVIAAFNLLLDFDFIHRAQENGAPKYMEWYSSFALMVTLIWLYLEILHLLMKLKNRNNG